MLLRYAKVLKEIGGLRSCKVLDGYNNVLTVSNLILLIGKVSYMCVKRKECFTQCS